MRRLANLRRNIIVLGVVPPALLAIGITSVLVVEGWRLTRLVASESEARAREQLARTARDVELLCEASHTEILRQVKNNMQVARDVLSRAGPVTLGAERVVWRAVSQVDGASVDVALPKLRLAGTWLGQNKDLGHPTPVVDEVQRLVGGAATIFQRMNERGDMLRVATTVPTREHERAVGTYIPALDADGAPNPVIAHVLRGEEFHGRAFVVDAWYLTVYAPLRDASGALVGMLFVGVRQDALESIREAIQALRVGASGDVVVLRGEGKQRGTYVISSDPSYVGTSVLSLRDAASGRLFTQDLIAKALALAPGGSVFDEYTLSRPGTHEVQDRLAAVAYFRPWDWVIVASMRRDEASAAGRRVIDSMVLAAGVVLALAAALVAAVAWVARRAAARMTRPVEALAQVLENVGQGFLAMDAQGAISPERSAILDRWFGAPAAAEPVWRYLGRDDEEFAGAMERRWSSLFDSGHPPAASLARMPVRLQRGNRTFEVAYRLVGAHGRVERVILVISDVTAALAKELRERQMQEELQQAQKMEAVGRLASGIAHDFNNLLVVIRSCSEFLLETIPEGDPRRSDAEDIRQAGDRAARLVAQLLAFGRKSEGHAVVTDLNAVVGGIEKLIRRSIGEDVAVSLRLAPEPWPVRVDPAQLEQVILNLVLNARDAMPCGGELRIETANDAVERATGDPARSVVLRVTDTGTGIPPEVESKIFEPFFTTKEPGKGTGLGLSTVFGIVRQSHGAIEVATEVGRGSTFTVSLPVCEDAACAATPAAQPREVNGRGEPVLLVEDEDGVRRVARRVLERNGFRVVEARNGADALLRARSAGVVLVITDVVMPGMSGPDLARRLRQSDPGLPILFMSGYANPHRVWEDGSIVLAKPFTEEALLRKVDEALGRAVGG